MLMEAVMGEYPGLSMVRYFREQIQESAEVSEGVEFYRWFWAPASARFYVVALPRTTQYGGDAIPAYTDRDEIEVLPTTTLRLGDMRLNVRFGMDEEHKIAVLFWGKGGPSPELPPFPSPIGRLAAEGIALMQKEERERKDSPSAFDRLMDKLDDGEDWKRGKK